MKAIFGRQLAKIRKERLKKRLEAKSSRSSEEQQNLDRILAEDLREKQTQDLVLKKSRCGSLSLEEQSRLDGLGVHSGEAECV